MFGTNYSNNLYLKLLSEVRLPCLLSMVKDIIIVEQTPDYTIRAKTGWANFGEQTKPQIGWYVGYLEKDKNVYFFATNIDIRNNNDASARIELTRRCFKDLALL